MVLSLKERINDIMGNYEEWTVGVVHTELGRRETVHGLPEAIGLEEVWLKRKSLAWLQVRTGSGAIGFTCWHL